MPTVVTETTLGANVCSDNINLEHVTLTSNVATVGDSCFARCPKLIDFNLTTALSLRTFGNLVFDGCTTLPSINFSRAYKFTTLGNSVFNNCVALTSVTFDGSALTTVGANVFNGCTSLLSVSFLGTKIGNGSGISTSAFVGSSITNISVPPSVPLSVYSTWIGYKATANSSPGFTVTVVEGVVCFLKGTRILTQNRGYVLIENLNKSDKLINHNGKKMNILDVSTFACDKNKNTNPYLIPKGYRIDSTYTCTEDLYLSPKHEILVDNMFTAIQDFGDKFQQIELAETYDYYHITTDNYFTDVIMANGIPSESFGMHMCMNMDKHFISALFKKICVNRNRKLLTTNKFMQLLNSFRELTSSQKIHA
jgi:hypothetical protein